MAGKIIHIIGDHNLIPNIVKQYMDMGENPLMFSSIEEHSGQDIPDEMVIATSLGSSTSPMSEDIRNTAFISDLLAGHKSERHVRIHFFTHTPDIMLLMQTWDLDKDLQHKAEIFPFSSESLWAAKITGADMSSDSKFPTLDREPISLGSDKCVHLVLSGMNPMSQEIAKHAALTCHFPNYTRDHRLRTRITMLDPDMDKFMDSFISRHEHLFANSYHRYIDLGSEGESLVKTLHRPQYNGKREDFVDIEWEFVKGEMNSKVLRDKIDLWASSPKQILTIVFCHEDEAANIESAIKLPSGIGENEVPVLIRAKNPSMLQVLSSRKMPGIIPFGTKDCTYDITLPIVRMAKAINHAYNCCYHDNCPPADIEMGAAEESWRSLSNAKKWSNIYSAMTVGTKMRSLGYTSQDWSTLYSISQKDIEILAEVEHNRWSVEELLLGYRPADDMEQKAIEEDIAKKKDYREKFVHYDLRAYSDLRCDSTGKQATIYDIAICSALPLIANTFKKGGRA